MIAELMSMNLNMRPLSLNQNTRALQSLWMNVYLCAYKCRDVYVFVNENIHACTYVYGYGYVSVCAYVYVYGYVYPHTHLYLKVYVLSATRHAHIKMKRPGPIEAVSRWVMDQGTCFVLHAQSSSMDYLCCGRRVAQHQSWIFGHPSTHK